MTTAPLHVLQLTDTHIFEDPQAQLGGINTRDSLSAVLAAASKAARPIDLVLLTGDLAAEAEAGAYEWLVAQLCDIDAPVLCIPGNHDVNAVMMPIVTAAGWGACGSHRHGDWHLVLLDSAVDGEEYGELAAVELDALARSLERYPDRPTLVVVHHHPVAFGSRWLDTMTIRNGAAFREILERHTQVRAVLCGHVHQNYDAYHDGLRVIATPSTCAQFAPRAVNFALDSRPPGYRWLELGADGTIATRVVRV